MQSNLRLQKAPSGIEGLDTITGGGFPAGRPTLIAGNAGCGKTLLAMQFLVSGAREHNEPGVFLAFEESREDLALNVASLGFDLPDLMARKLLWVDTVALNSDEIEEGGEYDLEGLFIRLGYAIDTIGAKRVVIDTLESLFSGLRDTRLLRNELQRLFRWLKERGVTALITAERAEGATLTRHGLEEYVSDCVIFLDNRVDDHVASRRLRIIKYRGSSHGTSEYPFLIDRDGISLIPITDISLSYEASSERISSGIEAFDTMLGNAGYYRGSTILVSGTAGTGKSTFAAHLVDASCRRGERALYFTFEESPSQILRNMRSIGIDLAPWREKDRLIIEAKRPSSFGLETHLTDMIHSVQRHRPDVVVIDPLNSFIEGGNVVEVKSMLARLNDYLKRLSITALSTNLSTGGVALEQTEAGISSLMDSWILLRNDAVMSERVRSLTIVKSRGMAHSSQVRAFRITDHGVELGEVLPVSRAS